MGLNISRRVEESLTSSGTFSAECDSTFDLSLSLAQHTSPLLRLYQLPPAASHLHLSLSRSLPLLSRWAPSPPEPSQVDAALRRLQADPLTDGLTRDQFRAFAVFLFSDMVLRGAAWGAARAATTAAAGVAGVSAMVSAPRAAAAAATGVSAAAAAMAVYLGLG